MYSYIPFSDITVSFTIFYGTDGSLSEHTLFLDVVALVFIKGTMLKKKFGFVVISRSFFG